MSEFANRIVVVTGGTSGIGRATALKFSIAGARVFVGDINQPAAEDAEFHASNIEFQSCDVRQENEISALIQSAAKAANGRIDVLINNAGVGMVKPIVNVTEQEWDLCMDTNLKAAFFGCKHAIPFMQQHGGAIVNVASNAGLLPRAHDPVYSTSKQAVVGFTRSLALCHSRDRIRVNAVCPGPVGSTGMIDDELDESEDRDSTERAIIAASPMADSLQRMIRPDEIASAIYYLASDSAMFVTGTMIAIDGGKSQGVPPPRV